MAKHENLDVLRLLVGSGGRNAKDRAQKEVDKGQQHGARCYWLSPQRANREFVHPSTLHQFGTGESKAAVKEDLDFVVFATESQQVIGELTAGCPPTRPADDPECRLINQTDRAGTIIGATGGFEREVRSPFVLFGGVVRGPEEFVITPEALDPNGECAVVLKEVKGIKAVVTPQQIPVWVEPWFPRRQIVGFITVWIWEFVPVEFVKKISLCNFSGKIRQKVTMELIEERPMMELWQFLRKDP